MVESLPSKILDPPLHWTLAITNCFQRFIGGVFIVGPGVASQLLGVVSSGRQLGYSSMLLQGCIWVPEVYTLEL